MNIIEPATVKSQMVDTSYTGSLQRARPVVLNIISLYFYYNLNLPKRTTSLQRTIEAALKCPLLGDSAVPNCSYVTESIRPTMLSDGMTHCPG